MLYGAFVSQLIPIVSLFEPVAHIASRAERRERVANQWKFAFYGNKPNKYRNQKIEVDGEIFDSKKEARRWQELKLAEKAGAICNLKRQVRFELIPAQREPDQRGPRGGVIKGKVIERAVYYNADFVYNDLDTCRKVVEDTKGMRTKDYIIKRKLLLYRYGLRIREV